MSQMAYMFGFWIEVVGGWEKHFFTVVANIGISLQELEDSLLVGLRLKQQDRKGEEVKISNRILKTRLLKRREEK